MQSASGWNLQIGEICKWVKRKKEVGEKEIYEYENSANGWNGEKKWVKTTN